MIRWLLVAVCALTLALTPIHDRHEKAEHVDDEFSNVYLNAQPVQFKVFESTPNFNDIQNGEIVIFSSGAIKLMLRSGTTIYQVNLSTI